MNMMNMNKISKFLNQFAINFEEKLSKIVNNGECGFAIETNGRISKHYNPIQTVYGDYQVLLYVGFPLVENADEFFKLMLREEINLQNPFCYNIWIDGLFNETNFKICCSIDNLSNDYGFIKFTDSLIDLMRSS